MNTSKKTITHSITESIAIKAFFDIELPHFVNIKGWQSLLANGDRAIYL